MEKDFAIKTRLHILSLEDSVLDFEIIREIIADAGYNLIMERVETEKEYIASIQKQKYDIILADFNLPGYDAFEALSKALEICPETPVIVVSGSIGEETAIELIKKGAVDYVLKDKPKKLPFAIKQALQEVKQQELNRLAEEKILTSELRYRRLFESAKDGILIIDSESGQILDVNPFLIEMLQYGHEEIVGKELWEIDSFKNLAASKDAFIKLQDNEYIRFENMPLKTKEGYPIYIEFISNVYFVGTKKIIQCNVRNITDRKNAESRQKLSLQVLEILNRPNNIKNLINDIFKLIKDFTGFDAVAIRLKEGDDYPYFVHNKFPDHFVEKENYLCGRDIKGQIILDSNGIPILKCMCGNVIKGQTNASKEFFTKGGIFWTNSTSKLMTEAAEEVQKWQTRNCFSSEGYESVALIPLKADNETIGLLQLNDKQPDCLTLELVEFFEGIAHSIGIALKRFKAEEEIRESRKEFQAYFDSNTVGLSVTNPDKTWIEVNQRLCDMFGYTKEELIGLTWIKLTHPDDIDENMVLFQEALDGKINNYNLDKRFIRKDGKTIYVSFSAVCQRNEDGSVHHLLSSYIDITDRKHAEENLAWEQYLTQSLMANIPDSIYFKDRESRFLRINKSMAIRFGLNDPHEAIGKTDNDFFKADHSLQAFIDEQEIIRTSEPIIDKEEMVTWVDQPPTWASTTKMPLRNAKGEIIGTFGISRDITGRKQVEEELVKAKEKAEENDQLKTAFLHNISHEVRTPMNAIIGFSTLLTDISIPPEKQKHYTDIVMKSSTQLLNIITDIISISKIQAGQEVLYTKEINLNSLCEIVYEKFFLKATDKNIQFHYNTDLPDNKSLIHSDELKIIQILSNLLDNAIKFTKLGHVVFGYALKDNFLEFYVEDSGIGIQPAMHEEIFKRFRQVESSPTREFGGSGLGLSISKAYVELLGGKIWLSSEPDKGSIFYFTIPFVESNLKIQSANYQKDMQKSEIKDSMTLLVAEDEDFNYMYIEELLSDLNSTIIRAYNGLEAVELCRSLQHFDLILMDLKMPIMDGYEATKQIKKLKPDLPIIAQTAYSTETDRKKALASGCIDFISKPFNKELLLMKINEHIEKPK